MRKLNPNLSVVTTIGGKNSKTITKPPSTMKHESTRVENVTSTSSLPTKIIYSRPTKIPSLIINVPNDAIFYTDNRNYQLSNGEFEDSTILAESPTSSVKSIVEERASNVENITAKEEEEISSTTQSTSTTLPISIDSTLQTKSFRKNYTNIPRRSTLTTTSKIDIISSTISSFLSNVSSKRQTSSTDYANITTVTGK